MSYLPQKQQPLIAYPETGGDQLLPAPSSRDNNSSTSGSYTATLIILAVILAFCSIARFLGHFCGRRCYKPESSTMKKKKTKAAAILPKEKECNIEFGFDHKKIETANRPVRYEDLGGHRPVLKVSSVDHGNKHFDSGGPAFPLSDD